MFYTTIRGVKGSIFVKSYGVYIKQREGRRLLYLTELHVDIVGT